MIKFFLALFIASVASAVIADDCITQGVRQFCAKDPLPCKTIEGVEYCPKDAQASTATAQPRVVYVQPQPVYAYPSMYYGYPCCAPVGVGLVFRFGGNHHRH